MNSSAMNGAIVTAGSVTKPTEAWQGAVLIAGSHGGVYAAYCAAKAGVRAVILNDAGRGKDDAGVGGGAWCDALALPYAAIDTMSARIGDGADMAANGILSAVNETARALGITPGMTAGQAAEILAGAPSVERDVPVYEEAREVLASGPSGRRVVVIDSASLVRPEDVGHVVITGSHGGLPSPDPASALKVDAFAAFFHDAGGGKDGAGLTRLPHLADRGIIAGTVSAASARIGDGRSILEDGVISHLNGPAEIAGGKIGMRLADFVASLLA